MNNLWWEKRIGNTVFYWGFFSTSDIRFGISIGNRVSSVDLGIFTFGFIR